MYSKMYKIIFMMFKFIIDEVKQQKSRNLKNLKRRFSITSKLMIFYL
jgi:hypothetical protein